jgi:hypothetical protein
MGSSAIGVRWITTDPDEGNAGCRTPRLERGHPRIGHGPGQGSRQSGAVKVSQAPQATEQEWARKRQYIESVRLPTLKSRKLDERMRFWPKTDADWQKLHDLFMDRAKEFAEEDHEYRFGHYREYAHLEGPYIRLKARPDMNMVGDHDLFGFTKADTGRLIHDATLPHVQKALQASLDFQAQHGSWALTHRRRAIRSCTSCPTGASARPSTSRRPKSCNRSGITRGRISGRRRRTAESRSDSMGTTHRPAPLP